MAETANNPAAEAGEPAPANVTSPETEVAETIGPDVVPITVQLPTAAIKALVDTHYLEPGEQDDEAAIGGALLGYLDFAWASGVRGAPAADDDLTNSEQSRQAEFHAKLARVNAD
jgi:hypothetical protein